MKFYITHLYPHQMELYGDMGNIHAMRWMVEQMGGEVVYQPVHPGEGLPQTTHFYFIGGGQDKQQLEISDDLISKGLRIIEDITAGVPLLAICGGYQLLGKEFVTGDGTLIPGVGLFPVITKALDTSIGSRCIGDVVIDCLVNGLEGIKLVGFENHSGQTYLIESDQSDALHDQNNRHVGYLGKVIVGKGNNYEEGYEGCVVYNAIGTYLHGSCLPKNPELTKYLIDAAVKVFDLKLTRDKVNTDIALKAKDQRLRFLL